jgi:hypothetical protein
MTRPAELPPPLSGRMEVSARGLLMVKARVLVEDGAERNFRHGGSNIAHALMDRQPGDWSASRRTTTVHLRRGFEAYGSIAEAVG